MANVSLKTNFKDGDKLFAENLNNNFAAIQAALATMNKIIWQDSDNAAGISGFRGTTEEINERALIDGQLLYNTETGETYIDSYIDEELVRINTGSGNVVAIQDEEPTNDAVKLWIETDVVTPGASEVIDQYSSARDKAYSANMVNNIQDILMGLIQGKVTQGSNANGGYIIFTDGSLNGVMICYGNVTGEASELIDYYDFTYRTNTITQNFPQEFTNIPTVMLTLGSYNGQVAALLNAATIANFEFCALKPKTLSARNYNVTYIAIGRWQ